MSGKRFEFLVAWRFLLSSRREGFSALVATFSFIGVVLGVATLIIVMAVMNGFRHELLQRVLGMNGHLTVASPTAMVKDYPSLQKLLQKNPYVRCCAPIIEKQGLFLAKGASGGLIRGALPADLCQKSLLARNIVQGGLQDLSQPYTAVIGHKLARKLHVGVGGSLKIMVAEGRPTAIGFLPRTRSFRVVGIFDTGMHEYDQALVFVSLATAQGFWDMPSASATHVEVFVHDPEQVGRVAEELARALVAVDAPPERDLFVYDWQRANAHFFNAIQVQRNVLFFILMLIILVAVFNIVSCLVMLVQDKVQDIAILRTLGASRSAILRIFLRVGVLIGGLGTAMGTALGLLFSYNIDGIRRLLEYFSGLTLFQAEIYFLSKLPAQVRLSEVGAVVTMALVFSLLATLYPAWKASRLHPVEGLRHG